MGPHSWSTGQGQEPQQNGEMVIWKEVREALSKGEAGSGRQLSGIHPESFGQKRPWQWVGKHSVSFVNWVTEAGHEWKTSRQETGQRPQAEGKKRA